MFKLNEDAPSQHMAILVFAGIMIFFSIVGSIKNAFRGKEEPQAAPQGTFQETGIPRYKNPELSWYEKIFCRGYQRAGFCSYRLLHPFASLLAENNVKLPEEPPEHTGVIDYRGPLPSQKLSGRTTITTSTWKTADEYFRDAGK